MNQSQTMDIDSLLQSHDWTDSDEEAAAGHNRTVEEILLNHSSSSPSPPSSPSSSSSTRNYFSRSRNCDDEVSTSSSNPRNPRLLHSKSSSIVFESDKYDSANDSSGTRFAGRVLPQLFTGGMIRSNTKPGAALAAAAAASRSIPTPHAAAIKLRRADTDALQRTASETAVRIDATDDSSLSSAVLASRASENRSDTDTDTELEVLVSSIAEDAKSLEDEDGEEREVELKRFQYSEVDSVSVKANASGQSAAEDKLLQDSGKASHFSRGGVGFAEHRGVDKLEEECAGPTLESQETSDVENSNSSVFDGVCANEAFLPSSLDETIEGNLDVAAEEIIGPTRISYDAHMFNDDEDASGAEAATAVETVMSEPGDEDGSSLPTTAGDIYSKLISPVENKNDVESQEKSHSSLKPLDLAEEIEKNQAFRGLHYEEGAAAQQMRLEGMQKGSTILGYFDVNSDNAVTRSISSPAFKREHGSSLVVAVHVNFIAIGMSKGSIFVLPSKYTPHQVDNMDTKMTFLGLQGDRSHVPVTSMCFNQQGDLLFAGYGDGHFTVWDVQKASALKVITEHRAPVVHILYLGQDSQVTRQFNVVSGDSKGVVKLIHFSVVPWLNRISYTTAMKLFDETTSRVMCASPLLYCERPGGVMVSSTSGNIAGGIVDEAVLIFITYQSALVAKVVPTVEVYAQIPKPDGVGEGAIPYAAWKSLSQSVRFSSENASMDSSDKVSLLAIAWDRRIQVSKLVNSKLLDFEKWTLESPAIGVTWLNEQMLVILTSTAQIYLFAKDGNMIHQTNFNMDGFHGNDLLSCHLYFTNSFGNPENAYHNSVAIRGSTIYMLGSEHLVVARLLSWKERIEVLRRAGDWMGALNMAVALYDGQLHGVVDLPNNLNDIQMSIMPYLVELLQSYVSEVFSYLSVAHFSQNEKLDQLNEIKEQYTRVGGVAVEFCVHIGRTDILFDNILLKFYDANQKETFLELLEPYILKDMLGSLPPMVMQALVEYYDKKGWLQRIEQCILHMDIISLDFNQVVRLCREHRLHSALIYLFNRGLDDFRTPLEELLVVLRNSKREDAAPLGYRMLVYLKYCFKGLAFPPGHGNIPSSRLPSLREELLCFLLEASSAPNSWAVTSLPSNEGYVNLLHLLEFDTEAALDVLKCAFTEDEIPESNQSSQETTNFNLHSAESHNLVQKVVDIFSDILDATCFQRGSPSYSSDISSVELWPSKKDVGHIYDFISYYVAVERVNISRDILTQIMEYLTSESNTSDSMPEQVLKRREKQLLSLLEVVPETLWDASHLLQLCEKAQFHQVHGYIRAIKHQYVAALDSYIKLTDEPIHAFSFIHDVLRLLHDVELEAFEFAVISRIPDLVKLCREGTYFLVIDHFSGKTQHILSGLRSRPESLFLYLKTVVEVNITGRLDLSPLEKGSLSDFPSAKSAQQRSASFQAYLQAISSSQKFLSTNQFPVTDELTELYFELLCQYEPQSVLKFLETSESYRVEHCLRQCQEYGIIDAASFLLERVGDVGSALQISLSSLAKKFIMLDAEIKKGWPDNFNALLRLKVVAEILDTVRSCITLCQRNSPRLVAEESELLWFQLLDSFCEPLMDSDNAKTGSHGKTRNEALNESSFQLADEEGCRVKWKVCETGRAVHMMRKLFSIFIKEIVEGMIGYVRLPRIMLKLLSDNANQEFGNFKLTILGMLGSYDFERRILDTAKSLIEDDTYYTMSLLRKGASHGYAPRDLVCCICNTLLAKSSSSSSVVFSCGHAMHLHCGLPEDGDSYRGTLAGCPICSTRKKAQRSSGKSVFVESSLVSRTSRMQAPRVTPALRAHDYDGSENSFYSRPASRFDILNNLQKDQKSSQIENMPQLRLAPPALYHEKLRTGIDTEENTTRVSAAKKPKGRQLRDVKMKGSSLRLPLKSNIFGKEKMSKK